MLTIILAEQRHKHGSTFLSHDVVKLIDIQQTRMLTFEERGVADSTAGMHESPTQHRGHMDQVTLYKLKVI